MQKFNLIFTHLFFASFGICCGANNDIKSFHLLYTLWNTSRCSNNFCDYCTLPGQESKIIFCSNVSERTFKNGYYSSIYYSRYDNDFGKNNFLCLVRKGFYAWEYFERPICYHIMALLAEEIGWRGYLEPWLEAYGLHRRIVPCIVGAVWCLWHYHFFLRNGIQVPMPLFFISCIVESYIYSFLMSVTNHNIVSAMIYHFAWNLLIHVTAISPVDNNGSLFPYIILVILEVLVLPVCLSVRKINQQLAMEQDRM